jgi:DNA recombination protein RmuC
MDVLSIVIVLMVLLIALGTLVLSRKPPQLVGLNTVSEALTNVRIDLKSMSEKVQSVEQNQQQANQGIASLAAAVAKADTEVQAIAARVQQVEQTQSQANQNIASLTTGLAQANELTRFLAGASEAVKTQLSSTTRDLASLHTLVEAKQHIEQETSDVVRRLETVITGTQTKGAAGENILEHFFSKLPLEWQVRDLRIGDKRVEFGLRLPNHPVLPIDSKWTATNLLEEFARCHDMPEQAKIKNEIAKLVLNKAREVTKYIDPNLTMPFGVAAVPDAVYDLCAECHAKAFEMNVVIISYSMFVPYLLLVAHTMFQTCTSTDIQRLEGFLRSVQESVTSLQEEVEGRLSRALAMLSHSRDEMRAQLGKAVTGLTSIHINTDHTVEGEGKTTSPAVALNVETVTTLPSV